MAGTPVETVDASNRSRRYRKAAELLRKWMAQEDDYDERTWPELERELKDGAMRCREIHEHPA